mgnify:CR=1 FL=1|jgi:ArsR family transcriptional regulator, arsenate/arsenite/antimonite-responsive transcriptional repressor
MLEGQGLFFIACVRPTYGDGLTLKTYFDNIGNMKTKNAVNALAALAQESRLEIFRLLVRKGAAGMAAGDLSSHFGMPPATMSFHLKELSNAGLIVSRRESRSIIYSADYDQMRELLCFLMENCCADNGGKC